MYASLSRDRTSKSTAEVHMRTDTKVAALSLALFLGACGRRQEQTAALSDDLKRDLAAASASGGDLVGTPRSYQPMRFVSDIERWKTSAPAKQHKTSRHAVRHTASHQPATEPSVDVAPDPVVSTASAAPAPPSPEEAPIDETPPAAAPHPSHEPASTSGGSVSEHGHGGGIGGLLAGIIGSVVIRGGRGPLDKCDPRTDGRARPGIMDRPDFGMPVPTGPIFPRSPRW
jgi:hypothetical protein